MKPWWYLIGLVSWLSTCNCIAHGTTVTDVSTYGFFVSFIKPALCGGVLISTDPPWVLTAAHCILPGKTPTVVGYGGSQMRRHYASIRQSVTHPLYVPQRSHSSDEVFYDIGLVQLTTIDPEASRVAIGATGYDQVQGVTLGMGYTGLNEPEADRLQSAQCYVAESSGSMLFIISNATLCHGDSGGPLLAWVDDHYVLVGILNRIINAYDPDTNNTSCPVRQRLDKPMDNAFVKVAFHMDWIVNTTQLPAQALTASAQTVLLPYSISGGLKVAEKSITGLVITVLCTVLCNYAP
ncbi:hypothetical protein DFQ28_007286 [Apophysomyces sp. BC1034]|nr:hypothetical protein DFQ30_007189 [Apophysomyces sp. BC1015]KAG0178731.1 hypothetical protein DFQ29_003063 [Apophysomyces sp. BC1021]KAG0186808.1 hypothetical protein DFQ28_007286 [Apophysomyces sp. BC1034]